MYFLYIFTSAVNHVKNSGKKKKKKINEPYHDKVDLLHTAIV